MSTIEKLSIQGIRSFGPNTEDCQVINFSSPLTLILGENGCGKTTIIECIKYALTGDSPPGSDRGKNFVHDPKIFGHSETLAQIKVQVRNKLGARLSVCRSMKVFERRGKVSFESSEPTLNFLGGDGCNEVAVDSISKRCADTDIVMTEFMGVSKAIINNVLFCHQEDSSWPLDEPKKLKEKFDAIFGITEYNKAIEKIMKMRKEKVDMLKVMEADLKFLVHLKQEMENKSLSLEKYQQKCQDIKAQCVDCDDEMKPIEARLLEIRKVELEVGKYQAQKVEIETKHKNCREQILNLDRKIKKKFEGSLCDLEMEIRSFGQNMLDKKTQQTMVKENLNKLVENEGRQQRTMADLDKKRCVAQQKYEMEQQCKQKHAKQIKTLCQKLQIELELDSMATPSGVTQILENINLVLSGKQSKIVELSTQCDADDNKRQKEIDALRVNLTKSEESVLALQKQKSLYEKDSNALEGKISSIEVSMQQLKVVNKKIEEADEMYEKMLKSFNQATCRETIDNNKLTIAQLQKQFQDIDEKLTFLNSITKLTAEIGIKERELEKKEQEVRRVKSKHSDNFNTVFATPVTGNYRRALQISYEKFRQNIKDLTEKSNMEKLNQQSHEIKRKNLKDEITRMEKDLEESKELVFQKCRSTPYEDLLARSKATVTKQQLEHGVLKSAENMYKKYMQKIDEDPCCPLCHKGLSNNELADLNSELVDEIQKLPENIARTEKLLFAEQSKYENLLQLKPTIEKVNHLECGLPQRKNELKKIEEALAESSNNYESIQMLLAEPTLHMDVANSMLGDMSLLDDAIKEAARLKIDLEELIKKLPDGLADSSSIEALQIEKKNVSKELETERKNLEANQQTFEKQMNGLNCIREGKNKLKDHQIKLQEGLQSLPQLKERYEELTQLLLSTALEIKETQTKLQPLREKLNTAITEKAHQKDTIRKKVSQLQKEYDGFKSIGQEIQRLDKEVNEYHHQNLSAEVSKLSTQIDCAKKELAVVSEHVNKMTKEFEEIKIECLNQVTLERDLKDNRELKHLQQKEIELNKQSESLNRQLGNMDFPNVAKEKNQLIQKRDAATVSKGEMLGQIGEINNQIEKLKREIGEPKYKESIQNYRRANFEAIVTRRIIEDLGQHRLALEWSLIQFHAEKMEKINRLIREYWRLIYRGNDIDYLQIKTEKKDTDTSAERRRSYNYCVVQSKNNSEIEMRGRCSAGQRVLGSLIIRMALAETFSSNCGVLALDEPTTNLDRLNIVSLCEALNRIVEERQTQSNFMLIIITHDEEFISALGKIHFYHRVFRNDECKSVIRKVKVT